MSKAGKGPGAPSFAWTAEIEDEIMKRIVAGESLRSICEDDWLPSRETVRKRLIEDDGFAAHYARAREAQADTIFDEVMEISDAATAEDVQVARLRIDARKWMAGKLRPKVYGDKLELSGNADAPLTVSIVKYGDDQNP